MPTTTDAGAHGRAGCRPKVDFAGLAAIAERAGLGRVEVEDLTQQGAAALLEGHLQIRRLPSGIEVHVTDATETADAVSRTVLEPGLTVSLVLEGGIDARLGAHTLAFGVGTDAMQAGDAETAAGRLWTVPAPVTLVRRSARGRRVRKVNVSVPRPWVEDLLERDDRSDTPCDAIDLFGDDVAIRGWSPSQAAVRYGEELLGPHYGESPMTALSAQMSAIGLLQEALAEAVPPSDHYAASHLDVGTIARARAARQFMLAHVTAPLSLSDIARATGMSVSTLQRAFRQCYGVSVMGFLRRQRLDHARRRLERDGLSVAEAAAEAGYRTAANFTTAFRRAFGYPPSKQYSFSGKCSRS